MYQLVDKGLDLLVSFRVYDPDGDQEETLPERYEELAGEAGSNRNHGAGDDGGEVGIAGLPYASPTARQEELEAMAAAAAPGGLAARPPRSASGGGGGGGGVVPLDHPLLAAGDGDGAAAAGEGSGLVGFPGQPGVGGGVDGVNHNAVGGGGGREAGIDAVAAPAADGWGLAGGGGEPVGGGADGNGDHRGGGGDGRGRGVGRRRGRRYFGLLSRDEWISASSSRIEKLNSRAPWRNSWTEEAPVNDRDDPYLTDDGNRLVFAVPRAPVDGAPCLVSDRCRSGGREGVGCRGIREDQRNGRALVRPTRALSLPCSFSLG